MKPDFDLMRRMLLAVEDAPDGTAPRQPSIDDYSQAQIGYHAHLLVEGGLAQGFNMQNQGNAHPQAFMTGLTMAGHEFAGLARDDFRWTIAMASAQSAGEVTLGTLKDLLARAQRCQLRQSSIGPVPSREFPKSMYHATRMPRTVYSAEDEAELGPEWSREYIRQEYPKVKYHWSGKEVTVKSADEDAAMGGGWADSPAAFNPYKGPRPPRTEQHDPTKWLDGWSVPDLSSEYRRKIRAQLLRADGAFERSPDPDAGALASMHQAFGGIAAVLFDAGILTEDLMREDIPQFVWDSAIAGGWWRLASETRQDIFPEQVGHYWVWRDDSRDWKGLFRAETAEWQARLLEAPPREMPAVPASKWTVCPNLDSDADAMLFDTEEEARAWLRSNGTPDWLEDPLPVISIADCIGPEFSGPRLGEWHRAEDLMPFMGGVATVKTMVESGISELRGQTAWPTCYLAPDWDFESLEEAAWLREGHDYASWRSSSAAAVLFKAICDFDGLIRPAHSNIPGSLVVSFCQSYQVHRHVNRLSAELKRSNVARILHETETDWDAAKWAVRRALNTYARKVAAEASDSTPKKPEASDPPPSRTSHKSGVESVVPGPDNSLARSPEGAEIGALSTPIGGAEPAQTTEDSSASGTRWPDPSPDFASEAGRTSAVAAYTEFWKKCSEASLARTAKVDPADLSKWKKGLLPSGSDKKARIENALRNNDAPTPAERPANI